MNQLVPFRSADAPPALVAAAGGRAQERFIEFFTANIRNRNTRRAYAQAVGEFLVWCEKRRVPSITAMQPVHVAGCIEELTRARSSPSSARSHEKGDQRVGRYREVPISTPISGRHGWRPWHLQRARNGREHRNNSSTIASARSRRERVLGEIRRRPSGRGVILRMRHFAVLTGSTENDPAMQARLAQFRQSLQELGWTEGRNIQIDYRWSGGHRDLYNSQIRDRIGRSRTGRLLAVGGGTVGPLQQASRTVPIVFVGVVDPVGRLTR
jgi:hypothetical protein